MKIKYIIKIEHLIKSADGYEPHSDETFEVILSIEEVEGGFLETIICGRAGIGFWKSTIVSREFVTGEEQ